MGHSLLGGMGVGALAVAAVVEGEDVDAEVVEGGEGGDGVGEGAVAGWEEEEGGVCVAGLGGGGNPPAGELGDGCFVGAEVDELVWRAADGGGSGGGSVGVKDKLPLALIEEEAEREVATDDRCADGGGDGFEEPARVDCFGLRGWLWATLGRFCGGTRHEGVYMNFSIRWVALDFLPVDA